MKYLVFLFVLIYSGCGESKIEPTPIIKQNGEPNSFNVTYISTTDDKKVKVLAYGENITYKSAQDDSRRAAIWFVLNSGIQPILKSVQERTNFRKIQKDFYDNIGQFIYSESKIKSKSQLKNNFIVSVEYIIDIKKLKEHLYKKGIIELNEPFKIQDYLFSLDKINSVKICKKCNDIMKNLEAVLYKNGVTVVTNTKIDSNLLHVLSKQNISDIYWRNSLNIGSDIYITVDYIAEENLKTLYLEAFLSSNNYKILSKKYSIEPTNESEDTLLNTNLNTFYLELKTSVESLSQKSTIINVMYEDESNTSRDLESFFDTICQSDKLDSINNITSMRLDCKYKISTKELTDFLVLQQFNLSNIFYSNNVLVFKLN